MKARRIAILATAITVGAATIGSLPAGAAGSVTGGDTKTREVGSALASCTQGLGFSTTDLQAQIYKPVPGKGAVLGQSFFFGHLGQVMADKLKAGMSRPTSSTGTAPSTRKVRLPRLRVTPTPACTRASVRPDS